NEKIFDYRKIYQIENIYYLLPLLVGIFILYVVGLQGPNLNGDPYLHLSIVRKALDGDSLSIRGLALTKTSVINLAYLTPVWHIFLAFLSRILVANVFTTWHNILYVLTVLVFLSWYFLAKIIFQRKGWIILALLMMMIFVVYNGPGYLFTRLGVPDTLGQLLLLPLALGLSFQFIFEKTQKRNLILMALISFILLILHGPHYFYLLATLIFFGLFYLVFYFKDREYKETLKKTGQVLLCALSVLILAVVALELRSRAVVSTLIEFNRAADNVVAAPSFVKFGLTYKYGYFLLPITLVFLKSKRILFVIVGMLLAPLIYFTPIRIIASKYLSVVFTDRLLANTALYFFVFALILGLFLLLIDYEIRKFKATERAVVTVVLAATVLAVTIIEVISHKVSNFTYLIFYAKPTDAFFNNHWFWFLIFGLLLGLIFILIKYYYHFPENLDFQSHFSTFLLMLILAYILISPSFVNAANIVTSASSKTGQNYFLQLVSNDQKALEFASGLPSKSVILADATASKGLAVLTGNYLAYNVGSAYENKFKWVFNATTPDKSKAEIVTDPKWAIDYIYLANPSLENAHFRAHPEIYQKIYSGKTEIYKIIK
ncbi:MAG: hypothetical protein M1429_00955, partial [Patescibacteria group bacterium]|nr:hypothetical protein [Patescibacteria group bacterium]